MTLWTVAHQASLSSTTSQSLLKFMSIETVMLFNHLILCSSFFLLMLSNYLILCRRLLLLPSVFSSIRIFTNELALCIRWPKYWSLSFSISPSNEYTGVISFRMGWFYHASQFENMSSLVLSLLYGPIFTSIHDYWKNHSFGYTDLCWQSDVSAF